MSKKEITILELLALMPAVERVEVFIKGVGRDIVGYVPDVKEKLEGTSYTVSEIYSDYDVKAKESYTIIEVI